MTTGPRRGLSTLDLLLLVGSAALGLGGYQIVWRGLFQNHGWHFHIIQDWNQGFPKAWDVVTLTLYASDVISVFIPLAAAWILLLPCLRFRAMGSQGRGLRRIGREPGIVACLAALAGWAWAIAGLFLSWGVAKATASRPMLPFAFWLRRFFIENSLAYVGGAVAVAWTVLWITGRWRPSANGHDLLGRVAGGLWILIGLIWLLRLYLPLSS